MPETFDCIVLGVGGFGSAALDHLARRGARVLGLEQFDVAHDRGSSHGETRIIRKAYFEHPDYVPLLIRAYELWAGLEHDAGHSLLQRTGLFLAGPRDGEAVPGTLRAAREHALKVEELSVGEARRRFLHFRFNDQQSVVYEEQAGYLRVEACVRAHAERAVQNGARLETGVRVLEWAASPREVRVRTARDEYVAAKLIVTAGPWSGRLLAGLGVPLTVLRQVQFWHSVLPAGKEAHRRSPAFLYELPQGVFYGFPSLDRATVKVAQHTGGQDVDDPGAVDRERHDEDVRPIREFVWAHLPLVDPQPVRHSVCLYTMTPDRHFIVDRHPEHQNVFIAAGFSGHGFKFTPVIGAALADLALNSRTDLPIGFLSLNRFKEQ